MARGRFWQSRRNQFLNTEWYCTPVTRLPVINTFRDPLFTSKPRGYQAGSI